MARRSERTRQLASRAVQIAFLLACSLLWYLATTFWGVNRLLLPNPVEVWHAAHGRAAQRRTICPICG